MAIIIQDENITFMRLHQPINVTCTISGLMRALFPNVMTLTTDTGSAPRTLDSMVPVADEAAAMSIVTGGSPADCILNYQPYNHMRLF